MQNLMAKLISSVLDRKYLFGKFGPKNQNCHFKFKFGTQTNLSMQNSMMMLTFSVLEQKYRFWANLVQNIKSVTLN